jgi:hypothetical protein
MKSTIDNFDDLFFDDLFNEIEAHAIYDFIIWFIY